MITGPTVLTPGNPRPEGALYFNGFYPGYLAVPPNTAYTVRLGNLEVLVHVVRHLRPVVVTDFGNGFVEQRSNGKSFVRLLREIPMQPTDTIAADVRDMSGQPETLFFATKEYDYCLYRRQTFTELTVGAEVANLEQPGAVNPGLWNEACARFLSIYRLVAIDVSVSPPTRLRRNVPIIRQRAVRYGHIPANIGSAELLLRALPPSFDPVVFSYREFALDMPRFVPLSDDKLVRIGHHLATGTPIPDFQEALTNAFETLIEQDNPRFALVDAFSVAELVSFDIINQLRLQDTQLNLRLLERAKHGDLSMRTVINSFLPGLLAQQLPRWPDLIKDLDQTRKWRDGALHRGELVTRDQALLAINGAQHLVFAVDACLARRRDSAEPVRST